MKKNLYLLLATVAWAGSVRAVVPEPNAIVYGLAFSGTNQISQVTAANTNIVLEARRTPAGPALASYTMGARPALGDFFSLRLNVESVAPVASPQSFQPGDTFYLTLTDTGEVRGQMPLTVGTRGQITRVDFNAGNIPPDWLPYLKHPADNGPADNSISAAELDAYTRAWRSGQSWPIAPAIIPIGYVTRAGTLSIHGGSYVFDPSRAVSAPTNNPAWWAANAPLWWTTQIPSVPLAAGSSASRAVPGTFQAGVPLTVTVSVQPGAAVGVYAVEEQPPAGWPVSTISNGGTFDTVNQKVKWGLFLDNTARTLSYTVTPPATATADVTFAGQAAFDGQIFNVGGQSGSGPGGPGNATELTVHRSNGAFGFKLKGSPGDSQSIDVSTNLVQWTTLTNVLLDANGLGDFNDAQSSKFRTRFYRTRDSNQ